jgi:hypothetical protein
MDNYDSVGFRNSAIRRINSTPGDVEIYNPSTGISKLVYAPKGSREEKILHATMKTKKSTWIKDNERSRFFIKKNKLCQQ